MNACFPEEFHSTTTVDGRKNCRRKRYWKRQNKRPSHECPKDGHHYFNYKMLPETNSDRINVRINYKKSLPMRFLLSVTKTLYISRWHPLTNLCFLYCLWFCRGLWFRLLFIQSTHHDILLHTDTPKYGRTFCNQFWILNKAIGKHCALPGIVRTSRVEGTLSSKKLSKFALFGVD